MISSQIIMLYTLNLYRAVHQLYVNTPGLIYYLVVSMESGNKVDSRKGLQVVILESVFV